MLVSYEWRGAFDNPELNQLHIRDFEGRVVDEGEWNWSDQVRRHSLGWVVARNDNALIGFVNVPWDGRVHAWIQDLVVATAIRRRGVASRLIDLARVACRDAGCEWLHVDFESYLKPFYFGACGFKPTNAGLIALRE